MPRLYNLKNYQDRRKELRRKATPAELYLWRYIKNDQINGYRFRRQFGIGGFIVDFYCPKLRLVVEVDGGIHSNPDVARYDDERAEYIRSCFIRIIRFTNDEVLNNIEGVLQTLRTATTSPSRPPS